MDIWFVHNMLNSWSWKLKIYQVTSTDLRNTNLRGSNLRGAVYLFTKMTRQPNTLTLKFHKKLLLMGEQVFIKTNQQKTVLLSLISIP